MRRGAAWSAGALAALLLAPAPLVAQAEGRLDGPFDEVRLADGATLRGLVLEQSEHRIELVEVVRPPGSPLYIVIRPISRRDVAAVHLAGEPDREALRVGLEAQRGRARIEAERSDGLRLARCRVGEVEGWRYEGAWFTLESTLDEAASRRCIVRVEQMFRAYRNLLPPRRESARRLRMVVSGTLSGYRDLLATQSITTDSDAVYLPDQDLVLTGSDLDAAAREFAELTREQQERAGRQQHRVEEFPQRFAKFAERLRQQGLTGDQIAAEKRAMEAALLRESRNLTSQLEAAGRRNEAQFNARLHDTLRRLYHEAFHAYLDRFVLDTRGVPAWLNEGLAQVFESAQLDGDQLRIDAPDPRRLEPLRRLLRDGPYPLAELLSATPRDFHGGGQADRGRATRLYSGAWGLVYDQVLQRGQLDNARLESLLEADTLGRQLELLGATELEGFEAAWRERMLAR